MIIILVLIGVLLMACGQAAAEEGASVISTGTWEGYYLGKQNNNLIQRSLTLYIDRVYDDGTFEGFARITGQAHGSYCFEGEWDVDGTFSFHGTEWIEGPNPRNFTYSSFTGTVENDSMTGIADGVSSRALNLTKTSEEYISMRIDLEQIPRNWKGEYDGRDEDGTVVRRNYEIHINRIDENGEITGTAEFTPSPKAPPEYGYTGAYYFGATVNARTGRIDLQGNKWNIKPTPNFIFIKMNGTIAADYSTIEGTTENGIWYMESQETSNMSLYIDDDNILSTSDGHRYQVFDLGETSWQAAKAYCEAQGGHLATITSQSENDYILGFLKIINCGSAYFGLSDSGTEGDWRWVTGERYLYSNWASGEPDNGNGGENYGMFYSGYENGKWNDGDFGVNTPGNATAFICEWDSEGDVTEEFTDAVFLSAVREALGLGDDMPVMMSACRMLTSLDVSGLGIESIDGIRYMTNLETLDCSSNMLTELDVSSIIPLMDIDCSDNLLKELDIRKNLYIDRLIAINNDFTSQEKILRNYDPQVFEFDPQHEHPITTGTWEGYYQGKQGDTLIQRPLTLYIDKVGEDGTFEGIAELKGSTEGTYYFDGTWELYGNVSFEGTEWIVKPSGNFAFSSFTGIVGNDSITGIAGGDPERKLSLTKISEEYLSTRIDLDQLPRNWKGEYDGYNEDGTFVRRNYEMCISRIDEDGELTGTAEFAPSPEAPAEYGYTGSYYFTAAVNARTGRVTLQGTSWIIKPTDWIEFTVMNGTIAADLSTISGTTNAGIWYMTPQETSGMSMHIDGNDVLYTPDGHRYRVYDLGSVSWEWAEEFCEEQEGHLATVTSQSENDYLLGYLRYMNCSNAYFGLTDSGSEGGWHWVTSESSTYSNWAAGQPGTSSEGENFAVFCTETEGGQWNVEDFSVNTPANDIAFICEWDPEYYVIWRFFVPDDLVSIGEAAFMGISAKTVRISEQCTTIESRAFADSGMKCVYLPASVASIGPNAFPEGVRIYTPRGSYAASWGRANGYKVIEK